jgi:ribonuclease HIII
LPTVVGGPTANGGTIGVDESGKGDYFGPLVVAGVWAEGDGNALAALGVRDSKRVSDGRARQLAVEVREGHPTTVVAIGPERYNEMYRSMGNLNRLLAWAHARVIENLLEQVPDCRRAISDQFGDARLIEHALLERGRQIELVQHPRAEVHPVVAAASLVARAEFLDRLARLGTHFGMPLPKGAGPPVLVAGKAFVARHGVEALAQAAKLHFRTTQQLGAGAS